MDKPVYLELLIELSKILMYEFSYCKKGKLCYIYGYSFIAYIKTDDIYKDICRCWNKTLQIMN